MLAKIDPMRQTKKIMGNPIRIGLRSMHSLRDYVPEEKRMEQRKKEVLNWLIQNAQMVKSA